MFIRIKLGFERKGNSCEIPKPILFELQNGITATNIPKFGLVCKCVHIIWMDCSQVDTCQKKNFVFALGVYNIDIDIAQSNSITLSTPANI